MHWREPGPTASDRSGDPFSVDPVMLAPELLGSVIDVFVRFAVRAIASNVAGGTHQGLAKISLPVNDALTIVPNR